MAQPDLNGTLGVILTIGINVSGDRASIVIPVCSDEQSLTPNNLCESAITAANAALLNPICDCLSSSAFCTFMQAEGMKNGRPPYRADYGTANPGTLSSGALPASCGALMTFYEDFTSEEVGARIGCGHNTIPGVPSSMFVNGYMQSTLFDNVLIVAQLLVSGFSDTGSSMPKFYRTLAACEREGDGAVKKIAYGVVRGYVGTQRRRIIPH